MKIKLHKTCTFTDWNGDVQLTIKAGDVIEAHADMGHYWTTDFGGIFKSEADLVQE